MLASVPDRQLAMGEKRTTASLRRRRQTRQAAFCLAAGCALLYCFASTSSSTSTAPAADRLRPRRPPPELLANLSLTEEQCAAAFPGLTWPVDDAVALGPFELEPRGVLGPAAVARIEDGKLYVLSAQRNSDLSQEMINSRTAALHQIHRALLTAPSPLPATTFALNIQDQPFGAALAYARHAYPPDRGGGASRAFLMPHFAFWAWPLPFVGSVDRAAAAVARVEAAHPSFADKDPRAVWRGTPWYGSAHNPRLRAALLAAAAGKPWADVEALAWDGRGAGSGGRREGGGPQQQQRSASNALPIEDFCRYRYVLYTEGITYSGRFQFLQMCASVVLTPPIAWMQHTTHLVRPLFSSSLDLGRRAGGEEEEEQEQEEKPGGPGPAGPAGPRPRPRWRPSERVRAAWPVQYPPGEANIVFVAPDWSDLEDTVAWLEAHPEAAAGIARRQRELFVGGGYFSPAAETCYWRALLRGWAEVARAEGEGWREAGQGVRFEEFSLLNGM